MEKQILKPLLALQNFLRRDILEMMKERLRKSFRKI